MSKSGRSFRGYASKSVPGGRVGVTFYIFDTSAGGRLDNANESCTDTMACIKELHHIYVEAIGDAVVEEIHNAL